MTPMPENFTLLQTGLNVQPLLDALDAHPDLWDQITVRQSYPGSAHHDTQAIFLRGPAAFTADEYQGTTDAYDYPALATLGEAVNALLCPVLWGLGATQLGYVLIVKLQPGGHVDEHIDEGAYADHFTRFHIALTSDSATLTVGGQTQHFAPGELWRFDHKALHSADNPGVTPRIHVIFDAVTPA